MSGTALTLDFVVIGAQRAGSSHLNACLRDHPEVYLCPDEVPYFEDPFFTATPPSALEPVFARARPDQRLGISRPEYLARHETAARIRAHSPDARVIAVLRDPVSRAVSAYYWYVQFGLLPLEPLDTGMERLLDLDARSCPVPPALGGRSGPVPPAPWGRSGPRHPHAPEILDFGFYGRHLARWLSVFEPERVLVLLSGELGEPGTFERVYRFLGVDPVHRPTPHRERTNAGVYDLRRLRVLRARRRLAWSWEGRTTYTYKPRRLRQPLRFVPNAAIVGLDRVVLSRVFGNEAPPLRPDLEARMRALYAPDVAELESLLERDLSPWR